MMIFFLTEYSEISIAMFNDSSILNIEKLMQSTVNLHKFSNLKEHEIHMLKEY